MKIMNCPLNGPRNISEFVCGGEVEAMPAPDAPDAEWADYVFLETRTPAEVVREWWMHASHFLLVYRRARHPHRRDTCALMRPTEVFTERHGLRAMTARMTAERLPEPFGRYRRARRSTVMPSPSRDATVEGFAGDTVASALVAEGVTTLSRSFKYRRPARRADHGRSGRQHPRPTCRRAQRAGRRGCPSVRRARRSAARTIRGVLSKT